MLYTENDIEFSQISPVEFENLCFEFVLANGYQAVTWRQGGADNGRDIEADLPFSSPFTFQTKTKWFFECKHYTNGVPPEELNAKIAWADAQQPDFLVILVTSYLTLGARHWLDSIRTQKRYQIIVVDGVTLKSKLVTFQSLIPKYFSGEKYVELYHQIKRHNLIYKITPSYDVIKEIASNIPPERLELNDLGLLLISFFQHFEKNVLEREYYGDFETDFLNPLYDRLRQVSNQDNIESHLKDYQTLSGSGFIDRAEVEENTNLFHQEYTLHLNYSDKSKWAIGNYLFVAINNRLAFELFISDNYETSSFFYENFNATILDQVLSKYYDEVTLASMKPYFMYLYQ